MRQPKYQLRMDQALLDALSTAGTTRVREVLAKAFPVLPGSTREGDAVVPQAANPVVPEAKVGDRVVPEQGPVVPAKPAWLAKHEAALRAKLGDAANPEYVERVVNDPTLRRAAERKYGANP